ncbi:phosphoglycolate phosphatase [Candidatus Macondimonas diazotrophica]|jgi:phosphoglycolate phosphatase|uniref:Phosphoglycolate phosphatase n=1 Tax=Candidatus Macondimonas diazotrophica TaxID=2305248 RepID=A0A4Z0FAH7_9GAMM|nr:phosphoglycolate phosphatase [Candidatus Macondimonas diazotrophica]NCU00770.1 phosphoglycolate phosphatase [Candidatus Macondimonas diazotrophica]TFZ83452.1 phosphoglycolate phosphatase [Candidatus Macondimonas diazotrophica]HBG51695.1 phosphoglycolate phosphatase [Gammaproteobacteria bacterium]
MSEHRRGILFDLDGTLVDSVPDLCAAVNDVLAQRHRAPLNEAEIRDYVGDGARVLLARALKRDFNADPVTVEIDQAWEPFMAAYATRLCEHSRLYPDVAETLQTLHSEGYRLGVVTNKPSRFIAPLLERLGIQQHFGVLVGGDTLAQRKPDPAPVRHGMAQLELRTSDTVMVGDSLNDVRAAQAAGCVVIGVSYGYNRGVDLKQAGAIAVIDGMADLVHYLDAGYT